ncbi:MAG: hypothetical protein QMD50_03580 [Patescibacteria group bacterium]|nr:hypothetical protein [Patescibacteria group bacterium]
MSDLRKKIEKILRELEKNGKTSSEINFYRHECTECHHVWFWVVQDSTCRMCGGIKINISDMSIKLRGVK